MARSNMITKRTHVTPEMAAIWMDKNTINRRLRPFVVQRYADDMRAGKWLLSHQGIAIDTRGRVLDGQHRLAAVVGSGRKFVEMLVSKNVPTNTQIVIDDVLKRTDHDTFNILGSFDTNISNFHVAIAKFMLRPSRSSRTPTSRTALQKFMKEHHDAIVFGAASLLPGVKGITIAPVGAACARAYYHHHTEQERLKRFMTSLMSGIWDGSPENNAIVPLRAWLQKSTGFSNRVEKLMKTETAIRAYMKKVPLDKIYAVAHELYPYPGEPKPSNGKNGGS